MHNARGGSKRAKERFFALFAPSCPFCSLFSTKELVKRLPRKVGNHDYSNALARKQPALTASGAFATMGLVF
jgi:hypothetical protein